MLKQKYKINNTKSKKSKKLAVIGVSGLALLLIVASVIKVSNQVSNNQEPNRSGQVRLAANAENWQKIGTSTSAKTSNESLNIAAASAAAAEATASAKATSAAQSTAKPARVAVVVHPAPSLSHGSSLYAYPNSDIATQARAWATVNPGQAGIMNRLAQTPMAEWFGDFSGDISSAVNTYVSAASAVGEIPELVAYNIPGRDCGSYSSGGAASPAAYQAWVSQFAAAIGNRSAVVIIEPDALAGQDCLSSADQQTRDQLIGYAVQVLRADDPSAAIYIDAGNSSWQSTSVMASRLQAADIAQATGFSLNISNFYTTASNTSYGQQLSSLVGGKHFVIDTSRNGNGPDSSNDWCNPDGRAFGQTPTLETGNSLIDGYLWIKGAGESDGQCGPSQQGTSAPAAGGWWPQYALMLAQNSGW
jgi:endoglucanase